MRSTYIIISLLLVLTTETSIAGKTCKEHKKKTCNKRDPECPNTYKCDKKVEKCCQYDNLPADCYPLMNTKTNAPWSCRGGGSIRCPDGYVCTVDISNRWTLCCDNAVCHDDLGNLRRKHDGEWTQSDGCTKCTCVSKNKTECDSRECETKCQNYGDYSSFSPCPSDDVCGKQVKIRRCDAELNKRRRNDPLSFNDVEQEMKTCYPQPPATCPQPGVALTEAMGIIVGGQEVSPEHNYGWMVHIDLQTDCRCGGSILSPRHILTAAHCFNYVEEVKLKTGKHNLSTWECLEQKRTVSSSDFKIHEEFNSFTFDNDIAILHIDPPLEFNGHTQPVKLPKGKFDKKRTRNLKRGLCKVIGWGDTAGKGGNCKNLKYSDVLLEVEINLETECTLTNKDKKGVTDNMICASDVHKDSCTGDSGGPLMCRIGLEWYQYGIVSWGPEKCGKGSGVYTKVANYLDWINDVISTDGGWGEWSNFTSCSASCGGGIRSRVRACTNPEPIGRGTCPGYNYKTNGDDMLQIEEQPCNQRSCKG